MITETYMQQSGSSSLYIKLRLFFRNNHLPLTSAYSYSVFGKLHLYYKKCCVSKLNNNLEIHIVVLVQIFLGKLTSL